MQMTDQEKAALLQFLGTTHAQAKQTDQMIVGQSQFLQPVSNNIQQHFAQALQMPTVPFAQNAPQYHPPQMVEQPQFAPLPQVEAPQAETQLELVFRDPPASQPIGAFLGNEEILEQLKEINLNLTKIAVILKESNVKSKAKNTIKD